MACSIIHVVLKKVAVVVRRTSKGKYKQLQSFFPSFSSLHGWTEEISYSLILFNLQFFKSEENIYYE